MVFTVVCTPLFFQIPFKPRRVFFFKATNGAPRGHHYAVLTDRAAEVKDGAVPSSLLSCPAVVVGGFFFVFFF